MNTQQAGYHVKQVAEAAKDIQELDTQGLSAYLLQQSEASSQVTQTPSLVTGNRTRQGPL